MHTLSRLFTAVLACVSTVSALNSIEVKGQDFVDSKTGDRFVVIGADYQPGGQSAYNPDANADALSNGTVCLRDAAVLQSLGVNTVRVYNVDPAADHDECVSIFNAVGIYMFIDVNSPLAGESIDRSNPSGSYTLSYLERTFRVVEAFKNYPNVLGFFAANEVMNDVGTAKDNPPYIRAVQRDLKNYIAKQASRTIPVGYSAADVRDILEDTWAYLQCAVDGDDSDMSRSDFFGLNSYSWCGGDATFQTSGYDDLVAMFENSTIPVFFSEYGCNEVTPRVFDEVQALYGSQMTALSGGLVYEYSQEPSDFGLVVINDNGTVTLRTDFDNLQSQFNKLNIDQIESTNSTATALTPPTCSSGMITEADFSKSFDIPSAPSGAQDLIDNGVSGANQGKLISVTQTAVPMAIYDSSGNEIPNMAIKTVSSANAPSGETTSGNGTSTASGSSASDTGAAGKVEVGSGLLGVLFAALLML